MQEIITVSLGGVRSQVFRRTSLW